MKLQDADDEDEKKVKNRSDIQMLLVPTKQSGNYLIYKKVNHTNERFQYTINNVHFPFGKEEYNDSIIYNIMIKNESNYIENILFELRRITTKIKDMADNDRTRKRYNLDGKVFYEFMRETEEGVMLRTYLKYGANITHRRMIGRLDRSYELKGKYGNVVIEIGSLWVNQSTGQYGVNVYLNKIVVL